MNGGTAVTTGEMAAVRPQAADEPVQQAHVLFAISPPDAKVTWNSEAALVQMLSDLVRASGGSVVADAEGILAATTGTALQALVLGVRAVRLATSYARYRPEGLGAFTVAIVATPENGANPEPAVRRVLAGGGAGWRILLAGEALNQLRALPGLQARKLPALSGQRVDIHELILPPITPDSTTAEMIVGGAGIAPGPQPAREPEPARKTAELPLLLPPVLEVEEPRRGGRFYMMLIAGVAAALILAGVAFKVLSGKSPAAPVPAAVAPAATASAPPPNAPVESAATVPAARKPERESRPPRVESDETRPAPAARGKGKAPASDEAQPKQSPVSDGPHGGYTADQLKAILDKADKLTANGKYEEAIRNYNVVLSADPGNGRAKAGKERAVTNMNMP